GDVDPHAGFLDLVLHAAVGPLRVDHRQTGLVPHVERAARGIAVHDRPSVVAPARGDVDLPIGARPSRERSLILAALDDLAVDLAQRHCHGTNADGWRVLDQPPGAEVTKRTHEQPWAGTECQRREYGERNMHSPGVIGGETPGP